MTKRRTVSHMETFTGPNRDYEVTVVPKESVTIKATEHRTGEVVEKTFNVGDEAEYDSYNLNYTGEILAIGPKTVTIDASDTGRSKKRLNLNNFAWRNYDFDAEKIAKHNAREMMCI